MFDAFSQIQNIELQFKNLIIQFENIKLQIQNYGINNSIGSQIQNMGILMLNFGVQMLNTSTILPNIAINMNNIRQKIQEHIIKIQNVLKLIDNSIQNIVINNNNMMSNNPFQMQMMNIKMDNNINDNEVFGLKYNVKFHTNTGMLNNIIVDGETTIKEMIKMYLKRIGKNELIDLEKIYFLFNGKIMNIYDDKKVKDLFGNFSIPMIIVEN